LTSAQMTMLDQLYGGKVAVAGTPSATGWAPPAWGASDDNRQLFEKVIKPSCWTCHAAIQNGPGGDVLAIYSRFASPSLVDESLLGQLCGQFTMPNSQPNMLGLWEVPADPIVVANKPYDAPADLLLARAGATRAMCTNLDKTTSCNRGADPDALCGNAFSGRACDRTTGQCVPNLNDGKRQPGQPNGVCKTDGSRSCPYPEKCQATGVAPAPGLAGYDGACVP
jgi:hypothetical protein